MFSTYWENFLPFSSSLKLLSANSFSLEESKFGRLGKGRLIDSSLLLMTQEAFVDSADQDQTAQNAQSDL